MKRFLRVMAALWPFGKILAVSHQLLALIHVDITKCSFVLFTTFCSGVFVVEQAAAQAVPAAAASLGIPAEGLQIGDAIPEAVWNLPLQVVNHPEGKEIITLNDYRGKLIILDFWATWCHPCVESLDKLNAMQGDLNKGVVILPVNSHPTKIRSAATTLDFIKSKGWSLLSVVDREQLLYRDVFPPGDGKGIPYLLVIQNGRILSKPEHTQVTKAFMDALLN